MYICKYFNDYFCRMQHFIYRLAPSGQAGVVLAKGGFDFKNLVRG